MTKHTGKVAIVTGGSRGIGRGVVELLAKEGADVCFTYRSGAAEAEALTSALCAEGLKVSAFQVDVRDGVEMKAFVESVAATKGRIDVLVNNAGIIRDNLLLTMEKDDWDAVLDTNLTGLYHAIRPVVPTMMRQRSGAIVNLTSVAGIRPGKGQANYAAAKSGVVGLTKALAAELASRGIRVNAVAPGIIETEMSQTVREMAADQLLQAIKLKRYGRVEDVARAVSFLSSDDSSYITGVVLPVDGGILL